MWYFSHMYHFWVQDVKCKSVNFIFEKWIRLDVNIYQYFHPLIWDKTEGLHHRPSHLYVTVRPRAYAAQGLGPWHKACYQSSIASSLQKVAGSSTRFSGHTKFCPGAETRRSPILVPKWGNCSRGISHLLLISAPRFLNPAPISAPIVRAAPTRSRRNLPCFSVWHSLDAIY